MRDVAVAPKLAALKDLLMQCGVIGGVEGDRAEEESGRCRNGGGPAEGLTWGSLGLVGSDERCG